MGRWLAEAIRYDEAGYGPPEPELERAAIERARAVKGSVSSKIVARAAYLPLAGRMLAEREKLVRLLRLFLFFAVAGAVGVGAVTAHTAFATAPEATVNFFWLILSLLGLHMLSFSLWVLLLFFGSKSRENNNILGRWLLSFWRIMASRSSKSRYRNAALQASMIQMTRAKPGMWLASFLSHIVWCGFFAGAVLMVLLMLSTQRYVFVWETTILSHDAFICLTQLLGGVPQALGLNVPDLAQIQAAEWPGRGGDGRPWSVLLVSAVILYGLVPRLGAMIVSVFLFKRAQNHIQIDLSKTGFARLISLVSPMVSATMVVDPDREIKPRLLSRVDVTTKVGNAPPGQVWIMGWEMDVPILGWPPLASLDREWARLHDLGILDERRQLQHRLEQVKTARNLARFVIVVSLAQSPDRGVSAVLRECCDALGAERIIVLFTASEKARSRLGEEGLGLRLEDWINAAHTAGIAGDCMIALDLDQEDALQTRRLETLLGGKR